MPSLFPPFRTLLPAEHGSWFMLGFPLALGLLLRPSLAGFCLGLAALACFLARPVLRRLLQGQRDPNLVRALLLFTGLAAGFGSAALLLSGPRFLIPVACLAPLAFLALRADLHRTARSLAVELAAQAAFAGLAAALLMAGGEGLVAAGRVWLLAALVGGANLIHVRRFLGYAHQLDRHEIRRRSLAVHLSHLLLLGASASLLTSQGWPEGIWLGWAFLLYLRALAPYRPVPARILGWREGGLSVISLLLLGWALAGSLHPSHLGWTPKSNPLILKSN
jgi:hypothetical protein